MYMDGLLLFDTALALTATQTSTNVVDLVNARDLGVGDDPALDVVVQVQTALLSAGATTLTVYIEGSTDNTTYTVYARTDAIPKASLVAGAKISIDLPRMPPQAAGRPRYLRMNYIVTTGPFTGGTLTAFIVVDDQQGVGSPNALSYAPGIVIAN